MTPKSFIYYGYDKKTYQDCIDLIRFTNRRHVIILNAWFLIVNLFYVAFSALNLFGVTQERILLYAAYTAASAVFGALFLVFPRFSERHSSILVYISTLMLFSYGIVVSVTQPYMPAVMFLILFTLVTLLYIGNMAATIIFALISVSIFLKTSYSFKTFSIAYHDTYNVFIVATMGVGLHYMFQRTRISQFVLYQRNQMIQHELEIKSSFDSLTGLLNRGRFFAISETVLRSSNKDDYLALCLLDLDSFKQINDKLGHQMGDKVIQTTGKTILDALKLPEDAKETLSRWDLVAPHHFAGRLGGDEFILLLYAKDGRKEVVSILQSMLDALNAVRFDGVMGIHASFGVTEFVSGDYDLDIAYSQADAALYVSKRAGKNQIHFYSAQDDEAAATGEVK